MKTRALALLLALLTATSGVADDAVAKIVLIAGPVSHPSGQHEFNAGCILLARALNEQSGLPIHVDVVHNGWPDDESVFEGARAVVFYSDGNDRHPSRGHETTVDAMVDRGVGIMCMHYAVEVPAGERGNYFTKWIGGHYEGGFSCNPHWTAPLDPNSDHPIARGVPGFPANDEWYYNIRFPQQRSAMDVLTSVPSRDRINRYIHWTPDGEKALNTRQTLMWAIERSDGGRGVGFTGGHWHRNWAIDDFRTVVLNGMIWTAGLEVPAGGVKSLPVTEAQLNENLDQKKKMVHISLPGDADLNQPEAKPVDYRWPNRKP